MKKQAFNPYLPSWEYIPDGEPHVFDGRLYVYGSHDFYNGYVFCMGDYVCYSAPVDDLSDWRFEGTIYPKTADPMNTNGEMCLYAPDVCRGSDGRYYLYYVLDKVSVVSVAVCDTPAGQYKFLGYVHYGDGTRLGEKKGDEPQFDPGVLYEDGKTYLYTGFCPEGDKNRHGAMVTVLGSDMLTVIQKPEFVAPGREYAEGTEYQNHAFFEAPSIRKFGNLYYFIYSSQVMHELCYATSKSPVSGFKYRGVIVSNADIGISSYKDALTPDCYGANNHGSLVQVGDKYYIFYHRHTNGTWYSRQGCAEKVCIESDGSIKQVEITSCGLNGAPLAAKGEYPAYIACNLFTEHPSVYLGDLNIPKIKQDGRDGDEEPGYITDMQPGATAGFKYFDFKGVRQFSITTRGYNSGYYEIRNAYNGKVLGTIPTVNTNVWKTYTAAIDFPDGVHPLYITYRGNDKGTIKSFAFD